MLACPEFQGRCRSLLQISSRPGMPTYMVAEAPHGGTRAPACAYAKDSLYLGLHRQLGIQNRAGHHPG